MNRLSAVCCDEKVKQPNWIGVIKIQKIVIMKFLCLCVSILQYMFLIYVHIYWNNYFLRWKIIFKITWEVIIHFWNLVYLRLLKCLIKVSNRTLHTKHKFWKSDNCVWILAATMQCSTPAHVDPLTGCASPTASTYTHCSFFQVSVAYGNQVKAEETVWMNCRFMDFWNEGYKFENWSAWESESNVVYKYRFQRTTTLNRQFCNSS